MADPSPIDRALKTLFRDAPRAFLRLIGADPSRLQQPGDVSINLPEFRADGVLSVDEPPGAYYFEWQWEPDPRVLPDWFFKCGALTAQLRCPVILVALYLYRGDRVTFPDAYRPVVGGVGNEFRFVAIRLWEHAERIRSGELPEFAPLLVLCAEEPTEAILREERALILSLEVPETVRADLLAIAVALGGRFFSRGLLREVFREEKAMIQETGLIGEWLEEAEARGAGRSAGRGSWRAERPGAAPRSAVGPVAGSHPRAHPERGRRVVLRADPAGGAGGDVGGPRTRRLIGNRSRSRTACPGRSARGLDTVAEFPEGTRERWPCRWNTHTPPPVPSGDAAPPTGRSEFRDSIGLVRLSPLGSAFRLVPRVEPSSCRCGRRGAPTQPAGEGGRDEA